MLIVFGFDLDLNNSDLDLNNYDLDPRQVVPVCFAIPLVVVIATILFVRLLTKIRRRHNVDDRISHLPSDNLGINNIGLTCISDKL